MDGIMNKILFAMKRYKDKMETEKKQIQTNKENVKKEWNKKLEKLSNRKRIEEDIRQHELNRKREFKNKTKIIRKKNILK